MPVKHAFVNPKADGGDATKTRPSNWNADHTVPELTRQTHATTTGLVTVDFATALTVDLPPTTGNINITLTNGIAGQWHALRIAFGGVHTVTFNTTIKWQGGTTPAWTSVNLKFDIVSLYYDGTNWYGNASLNH